MTDTLGDRMKLYEGMTETISMPGLPLLARLDGRAFHTFTKGMQRPYYENMSAAMVSTAALLVKEFCPLIAYTQSDEISLLWAGDSLPFGGRVLKISSVLASFATAAFNVLIKDLIPNKFGKTFPCFDGRAWAVPSREEASNYFLWRERDATKNSISMAAQSIFKHSELQNKTASDMQDMLYAKGVNWNEYPAFFKRGTFVRRVNTSMTTTLTKEAVVDLPEKHVAKQAFAAGVGEYVISRSLVKALEVPPLSQVANRTKFIFGEEQPCLQCQTEA